MKISHVGIAVYDLEKAISDYQKLLGFLKVERVDVESENVSVAMIKMGGSEIELLSPLGEGAISKFLSEKGEGIHHIAVAVPDVASAIEKARKEGFRVVDDKPRKGAWGAEAAFVHPRSAHGVLLEFYNR
ncbi:MAG: methylmalonyl-CoA epimerase [Nitrososphaerales archaeon]